MSAFFVWNPNINLTSTNELRFEVTNGDVVDGMFADHGFVARLLSELSVSGQLESIQVRPFRTDYYSDYPDSDEWWGVWPVAWQVRVLGINKFEFDYPFESPWMGTNAFGDELIDPPFEDDPAECIVIADFETESDLSAAALALRQMDLSEQQNKYGDVVPEYSTSVAYGKFPQLFISLGVFDPDFYDDGAELARQVQRTIHEYKGTTHHVEKL